MKNVNVNIGYGLYDGLYQANWKDNTKGTNKLIFELYLDQDGNLAGSYQFMSW